MLTLNLSDGHCWPAWLVPVAHAPTFRREFDSLSVYCMSRCIDCNHLLILGQVPDSDFCGSRFRGRALLIGMELVSGPDKAGLCYVLTIAPPLIITESQAEEIVTTVREALAAH